MFLRGKWAIGKSSSSLDKFPINRPRSRHSKKKKTSQSISRVCLPSVAREARTTQSHSIRITLQPHDYINSLRISNQGDQCWLFPQRHHLFSEQLLKKNMRKENAYTENCTHLHCSSENISFELSGSCEVYLKGSQRLLTSMSFLKKRKMMETWDLPTKIFTGQRMWREAVLVSKRTYLLIVEY